MSERLTDKELTTLEQHAKHNKDFTGVDMGGATVWADVKLIRRTAPEIRELREAIELYEYAQGTDRLVLAQESDRLRADNAQLTEKVLAMVYKYAPAEVAKVCDEELDSSGGLLGRVRDAALKEPDDE